MALRRLKQLVSEAQYKLASRKASPIVNRRLKSVDFDSQGSLLHVWHNEGVEVLGNNFTLFERACMSSEIFLNKCSSLNLSEPL